MAGRRLVASFVLRVVHECGNEHIPWNITLQHVQTGKIYRLAEPAQLGTFLQEFLSACTEQDDSIKPLGAVKREGE